MYYLGAAAQTPARGKRSSVLDAAARRGRQDMIAVRGVAQGPMSSSCVWLVTVCYASAILLGVCTMNVLPGGLLPGARKGKAFIGVRCDGEKRASRHDCC